LGTCLGVEQIPLYHSFCPTKLSTRETNSKPGFDSVVMWMVCGGWCAVWGVSHILICTCGPIPLGILVYGNALPYLGVPQNKRMHSHLLGNPNTWACFHMSWGIPHTSDGVPQYLTMHPNPIGYIRIWPCIPTYGGKPTYGNLFPYKGYPSSWEHTTIYWGIPARGDPKS
jgi:hypothetical protein